MYKLNDIALLTYGIIPGRIQGEGIAVKGIFDLPKRIGDIEHSWGDHDSVEPYVAADEIFLGGRDISFQGILIGSKNEIKDFLEAFKNAISAFTSTVPFETPYGTFCVLVTKFNVKNYNGGATIDIQFREPVVGAFCAVNVPGGMFYNEEYSDTATRNNCEDTHFGSEVTLTVPAGQFQSPISQAAANQLAVDWVLENIQDYANVNGVCTIKPVVYYNTKLSASLQKECDPGYEGSTVTYTVEAYKYSSLESQAVADAMAQAELDANLTQEYANAHGVCKLVYYNSLLRGQVQKQGCPSGYMGEIMDYVIPAGTFSSALSQAHANALAQADFNFNAQNYANMTGGCLFVPNPFKNSPVIVDVRQQSFLSINSSNAPIGNYVLQFKHQNGATFKISHLNLMTPQPASFVIASILALIDNTTKVQWDALAGGMMYDDISKYPKSAPFEVMFRFITVYQPWTIDKVWLSQ